MYALFAYIAGEWGIAGIDPHEECAVLFIDEIDRKFGEGTAFVAKLPDRENHTPNADKLEHHANQEGMQKILHDLEQDNLDLDAALEKLNKRHN